MPSVPLVPLVPLGSLVPLRCKLAGVTAMNALIAMRSCRSGSNRRLAAATRCDDRKNHRCGAKKKSEMLNHGA